MIYFCAYGIMVHYQYRKFPHDNGKSSRQPKSPNDRDKCVWVVSVIQYLCLWSFVFLSKLFLPSKSPTFLTSFLPCKSHPAYPIPYLLKPSPTLWKILLPLKILSYLSIFFPTFANFLLPLKNFPYLWKFSPTFVNFPLPFHFFSYLLTFHPTFWLLPFAFPTSANFHLPLRKVW